MAVVLRTFSSLDTDELTTFKLLTISGPSFPPLGSGIYSCLTMSRQHHSSTLSEDLSVPVTFHFLARLWTFQ